MPDRIRLDGKVAVVTGAAGVIGTATMRLLAERGARIVAVDRKPHELHEPRSRICRPRRRRWPSRPMSRDEDEVAGYVRTAVDRFGTIDVFYNNAGIEGDIAPITEIFAGDVSPGARRQRGRRLPRHETCAAGDAQAEQRQHHQHRVDRGPDRIAGYRGLQRQQARGDRADQKRRAGMRQDRCAGQLRLPRPDRQPDAERDPRRPQCRQRARPQ